MNSSLANKGILSPNYSTRKSPITKFTPHHTAVVASAEAIAKGFLKPERKASANYIIGNDGEIICCVPEEFRAWTSGNADNDHQAITIEVCNETGAPDWKVSDAALEALINLGVDVCRRYNLPGFNWTGDKNGTLTIHKMFQATACPGPYLEGKMPYIAEEITRRLNSNKEAEDMWYKVQVGAFRNEVGAKSLLAELKSKGYNGFIVTVDDGNDAATEPKPYIKVGSTVKIKSGAKSYEGVSMASYVYNKVYTVDELNGDRAVLDKNGLRTAFHIDNLVIV